MKPNQYYSSKKHIRTNALENAPISFLDLFAGAGGLSEGFVRVGYLPIAHVESDVAACYTLKTRAAYHWLKESYRLDVYNDYLHKRISRADLYTIVPKGVIDSTINAHIGDDTCNDVFKKIDQLLRNRPLDLVIGGPPCQAYSLAGRSRDKSGMKDDIRNYLYVYYARFLEKYQPKYFVFENVVGLKSAKDKDGSYYLDTMRGLFQKIGYSTIVKVLSAEEYGVPQKRQRVILIGSRKERFVKFPLPDKWSPQITVSSILGDLPFIRAGEGAIGPSKLNSYSGNYLYDAEIRNGQEWVTQHIARPHNQRDLEIYRIAVQKWNEGQKRLRYFDLPDELKTHKNQKSFTDRFKVVAGDLPASHTIVAHIAKDGHYYIHPDIKQNRSLTPREAARLQTFPDDYFFESVSETTGRTAAFRQIGNAVPVLLAQRLAEKLRQVW